MLLLGIFLGLVNLVFKEPSLSVIAGGGSKTSSGGDNWQSAYKQFVMAESYEIELSTGEINKWLSWKLKLPKTIQKKGSGSKLVFVKPSISINEDKLQFVMPIQMQAGKKRKQRLYWIEQGSFRKYGDSYKWKAERVHLGSAKIPLVAMWGRREIDEFVNTFKQPKQAEEFLKAWDRVTEVKLRDGRLVISRK